MSLNLADEEKKNFRLQSFRFRASLPAERKTWLDEAILARFLALREYREADVVYTYVSKAEEPDTLALTAAAFAAGKRIAVPRCVPGTIALSFYEISSLSELTPGSYGILEPDPGKSPPVRRGGRAVCVVPGLCFDPEGFRIGYGKGYYDRFLAAFPGSAVGLCYSECVRSKLPRGRYDRPVNVLVTEKSVCRTAADCPGADDQEDAYERRSEPR